MGLGDWDALRSSVLIIIGISFLFSLILPDFIDITTIQVNGVLSPIVDIVQNGISLSNIPIVGFFLPNSATFNPFAFLGETFQTYIISSLTLFSLIPDIILIPLLLYILLGIIWGIISLVLP